MRTFIFLLCTTVFSLTTENIFSQEEVTIDMDKLVSVDEVFNIIKDQSRYRFLYPQDLFISAPKVQLKKGVIKISKLLEQSFAGIDIEFVLSENNVIVIKEKQAQHQIKGTVIDANGIPMLGVNIIVKGTTTGTTTDFEGNYSLNVPDESAIIEISYIGYKTVEVTVGIQTTINVTLQEVGEALDEVVVTAFGMKKSKKALGYSVGELDSEDIEQRPEANLAKILQGKISGVIISTSGQTGAGESITIRGAISITGSNDALIILDNVPYEGSIKDIDANNILSMSILKGLNASLLYGTDGRNGVILIQTKSGNITLGESRVRASFSTTTYTNTISGLPDYQNTYGQGTERNFIPTFLSVWGPAFSDLDEVVHPYSALGDIFPEFDGLIIPYTAKPNNVKNLFRTGIGTIYSFNVSKSSKNIGFNFSTGYTSEEGTSINNDIKRFNVSIGGNAQITDKLRFSTTLNYSSRKLNRIEGREIFSGVLFFLPRNIDITELPFQNPATGESVYYRNDTNPLWVLNNSGVGDNRTRVFGTFNANYQFNDAFSLDYRVGLDFDNLNTFDFSNKGGLTNDAFRTGFLLLSSRNREVIDQTLILGYDKDLTDNLNLEIQVGANSNLTNATSVQSTSLDQIVYGFLDPSNFSSTEAFFPIEKRNIAGVFGQFQLGYKNYLYATLSARNDWGSTVEVDNQSQFYPGASVSFIPTSAFNFGGDIINYLKIRGAFGTSSGFPGQFNTRPELIIDVLRFAAADGSFPVTNRFNSVFANPDLKPEIHREFEIGIEARLFNNRVTLETSVYTRISKNQIVSSTLPRSTGFNSQVINLGRVDNEGIEVDLGIDIIKNKNLTWNLRNIFSATESLVVKTTPTGADIFLRGNDRFAIEGQPFGIIKGNYALKDDEGNYLIHGNGASTRVGELITSNQIGLDNIVIGDPNPDWRLTSISRISYKNFTFSTQIEYTHGGEIRSSYVKEVLDRGVTKDTEDRDGTFVIPGVLADTDTGELLLDADGNKIPNTIQMSGLRAVFSNFYLANDISMWDTSLFRLREIAISYSIKRKKDQKLPFNQIDITLQGNNLYFIAPNFPKYVNFDPESDNGLGRGNVPDNKRLSLGLTLTF